MQHRKEEEESEQKEVEEEGEMIFLMKLVPLVIRINFKFAV